MPRPSAVIFAAGDPALLTVRVRESEVAPGRLKVCFTAELDSVRLETPAGEVGMNPAPDNTLGQTCVFGREFRLEMN